MAQVLRITRPMERLITVTEVAERLGVGQDTARALVHRYGVCPSGKPLGRWYITENALHRAVQRMVK